ncbi:MAG: DEAD/DEAH box helicase [Ignavibacteria bacterium]|jgi:SNF2 family DNA or RNA helicase|nr:DEAD/DEAH box helicase [Ignavibacteria bacterium]
MKYRFKRKPRPYQLAALRKALDLDGAIALWFDPGLGKTKVAIDFMAIKRMTQQLERVLIICPLSAMGIWEDEMINDMPNGINYTVVTAVGAGKEKLRHIAEATGVKNSLCALVINYDSLRNDSVHKALKKFKPSLLIVDEMHYCKNHTTKRSKGVYAIRKLVRWVIGLTGTPIPKNPLDIFGQYKILDESIFGTNFKRFKDTYAIPHYMFPSKIIAWKNLDDMAKKIHRIACRVKDEEAKQLPQLIEQDVPVYFSDKSKKVYRQMAEEMIAELENLEVVTAAIAAVKATKLQQITGGFLMRTDTFEGPNGEPKKQQVAFPVGTEKLDVFMDLVTRYIDDHKILVGCRFLWEISQIESRLKKRGVRYVTVKGGMDGDARTEARKQFQRDSLCRVIIFQVSAATAMTLTAGDIGILYSCTRKWDDYWQWLKRIHRDGQTKPVYILRLVVKGTIDYQVLKDLETKRDFTTAMVDRSKYRDMLRPKF